MIVMSIVVGALRTVSKGLEEILEGLEKSLVWFVLWHINHYRLFNTNSCLYTHTHTHTHTHIHIYIYDK